MKNFTFFESIKLFFCGVAMGIADLVPGVSGGTIAFITGIYARLIEAIKSVDIEFIKLFFTGQFTKAFKKIPFNFLIPLLCGIVCAIFSLAHVIVYLLANKPLYIWTFFLGLILSSAYLLFKELKDKNFSSYLFLILGAMFAVFITELPFISLPDSLFFTFIAGCIAISAMILPGISGSFLLVLLGKYNTILNAVANLDIPVLLSFIAGALVGVLSFVRVLSYMLKHFYNYTVAFLTGIMCGSVKHILLQIPILYGITDYTIALICISIACIIPLLLNYFSNKAK